MGKWKEYEVPTHLIGENFPLQEADEIKTRFGQLSTSWLDILYTGSIMVKLSPLEDHTVFFFFSFNTACI